MSDYSPEPWELPNPWTGIPLVGALITSIQEELEELDAAVSAASSSSDNGSLALIIALS